MPLADSTFQYFGEVYYHLSFAIRLLAAKSPALSGADIGNIQVKVSVPEAMGRPA